MACVDDADLLRFARSWLDAESAATVKRHLARCERCSQRLEQLRASLGSGTVDPQDVGATQAVTGPTVPQQIDTGRMDPVPQGQEARALQRGEAVGRYLLLDKVGEGGMGVVYAAWDPELNRRIAVKVLRPDKQSPEGVDRGHARLLREAQAMAKVSHPNVIAIYDVGTLEDRVFMAMEFVDGLTLKKWVKEKSRSWREVLDAFIAAGRGLASAHKAGLVHRDFKPENVLVARDGRVQVTDFGLARQANPEELGEEPGVPEQEAPALPAGNAQTLAEVTQAGQVMGTPMYMAPEQRRGEPPDARSDQFSFCVALYWALYQEWPFDRQRYSLKGAYPSPGTPHSQKHTAGRSAKSGSGRQVDPATGAFIPPHSGKVPGFLRRALMRGLAPKAENRFASMDALLAQLEYRPRVARQTLAAAGLVLLLGAGAYAYESSRREAQLCSGAEQKLAGIWDGTVRQDVTRSLTATGQPGAITAATRVSALLDDYARGWVAMHTEACQATRLRGEQTEQLLSLRTVCLERRLKDVKALTRLLTSADGQLVSKAAEAVGQLPDLQSCADVSALSAVEPPPASPQAKAEIERISTQLAEAKALHDAGRYKQGLDLAAPAAEAARKLGYRPLLGEALHWFGWLQDRSGELKPGERNLLEAAWTAQASHHDLLLAQVAAKLAYTTGADQQRFVTGHLWSGLGLATVTRLGGNDKLESEMLINQGIIYSGEGKVEQALASYAQALERVERAFGKEHQRRGNVLINQGALYAQLHETDKALAALTEGLALIERTLGPEHDVASYAHYFLSSVYAEKRDYETALRHATRGLEIRTANLGAEHHQVADSHDSIATVLQGQSRFQEALRHYQKAADIKAKALGADHVFRIYSLEGMAQCHLSLGHPERALPVFEEALALNAKDPFIVAEAQFGLARALRLLKKERPRTLTLAQEAKTNFEQVGENKRIADVDAWLAEEQNPVRPASHKAPARKRTRRR
jgi:serine/threonine protein kinase